MGIYIPNMEKPKSCWDCECHGIDVFSKEVNCNVIKRSAEGSFDLNQRPSNCPLIEIDETKEYYIGQGGWIKEVEVVE